MQKENLTTIGLIIFLVVMIFVALYYTREYELVATRPDLNSIVSRVLGDSTTQATPGAQACPETTCPPAELDPTEQQFLDYQANPPSHLITTIPEKLATQLAHDQAEAQYYVDDQLWWRAENSDQYSPYRILVTPATVLGFQVPTTNTALELTPTGINNELHPAAKHPLFEDIITEIDRQMKDLDYKKSAFESCPVNEAYDPFNNCLATYTLDDYQCSLIGGYGRLDRQTSASPYLRLELACSNQFPTAYAQAQPYLYALELIDPEWRTPDMAVHSVQTAGEWSRVSFGQNYGIFQKITSGLTLVHGGDTLPTCALVQEKQIPLSLVPECL